LDGSSRKRDAAGFSSSRFGPTAQLLTRS
jgi:hypothetical protein